MARVATPPSCHLALNSAPAFFTRAEQFYPGFMTLQLAKMEITLEISPRLAPSAAALVQAEAFEIENVTHRDPLCEQ